MGDTLSSRLTEVVAQAVREAARPLTTGTEGAANATINLPLSDIVDTAANTALQSPTIGGDALLQATSAPSTTDAVVHGLEQATAPLTEGAHGLTSPFTNPSLQRAAGDALDRLAQPLEYAFQPVIDTAAHLETAQVVDMVEQGLEVAKVLEPVGESVLGPLGNLIDGAKIGAALADGDPHQVIKEVISLAPGVGPVITTAEMIARASGASEHELKQMEDAGIEAGLGAAVGDATGGLVRSVGEQGQSLMFEGMYVSSDGGRTWRLREPTSKPTDWLRSQILGGGLLGAIHGLVTKLVAAIVALAVALGAALCATSRMGDPVERHRDVRDRQWR